jgi:predicted GNAT family N-acyltransferase
MITIKRIDSKEKADLEAHLLIRKAVFQEEQGVSVNDEYDRYDKARLAHWYIAIENGTPIGASRWRENKTGYKLERICVLKEHRKKGVATKLIAAMITDIPNNMGINLASQFEVVTFYEKLGFRTKGEPFWEANILHRYMKFLPEKAPAHLAEAYKQTTV